MQRRRVAVVAGGPVALGDLVAEVAGAVLAGDAQEALAADAHLVLPPVQRRAHERLHVRRLGDVGLVVAAQVGDLPLVEQHRPGERGDPGAGERADAAVGACRSR